MGFFKKFKKVTKFVFSGIPKFKPLTVTAPELVATPKKSSAKLGGLVLLGVTAGTSLGRNVLMKGGIGLGKSFVKRPVKTLLTGLTTLTVATALKKSPKLRKKTKEVVIGLPKTAITGGEIIAETIETGKSPVTPKQALIGGGLLAGAVVTGAGVIKGKNMLKEKIFTGGSALPTKDITGSGIPQPNKDIIETPLGAKTPTEIPKSKMPKIDIDIDIDNRQTNKRFINTGVVVKP